MTDFLRGGGFGSGGLTGPFHTGGGGFGQFEIGAQASQAAALDKYAAQTAWGNGQIGDDAYIAALEKYLKTTAPKSRERISAQNELDDANYTIGRNKLVRSVNNSVASGQRVSALNSLIAYDQKKLAGEDKASQAYRDLQDRISGSQREIRTVRYNDLQARWSKGQVGTDALIAFAQQALRSSAGASDHQDWTNTVASLLDRQANEQFAKIYQDYQMNRVPGSTVLSFIDRRLSSLSPTSSQYADLQRQREDLSTQITAKDNANKDATISAQHEQGTITDDAYLTYLHDRLSKEVKGTASYTTAQERLVSETFRLSENRLQHDMSVNGAGPDQLLNLYQTRLNIMDPGSDAYRGLSEKIAQLRLAATQSLNLFGQGSIYNYSPTGQGSYVGGHWIGPGGTPTNAAGFASQFDGSAFASTNCTMAADAMLAWAVTGGQTKVSGGDMRYYSGDRVGGTDLDAASAALRALGLGSNAVTSQSFDSFYRNVAGGKPAVLQGWYGNVPSQFNQQPSFTAGHAVFAAAAKTDAQGHRWVFIMDPLGRAGYKGQWWPEEVVKAFAFAGSNVPDGLGLGRTLYAGKTATKQGQDVALTPFQAFDTDYSGNSTLGRGGGINRQEAGPTQDWSKGKPKTPTGPMIGSDAGAVSAFLGAVQSVGANGPLASATDEQQASRAKALLDQYKGDARLAALAWFTGNANVDTTAWSNTDRFYVNAVATALGYAPVPVEGVGTIIPGQPAAPTVGTQPGGPGTTNYGTPTGSPAPITQQGPEPTGPAAEVAKLLLQGIGAPITPDMIRAAAAWIAIENGGVPSSTADANGVIQTTGGKIDNNNPFNLRTAGPNDLPGQIGRTADGRAIFDTAQNGTQAAINEIKTKFGGIVASAHAGDPGAFLTTVDGSGWTQGGYGGQLVGTYNKLPGAKLLVGGIGGLLQAPADFAMLAHTYPDVANLFAIDPRDKAQFDWFKSNVNALTTAQANGQSTWTFTSPSGNQVALPFSPTYAAELTAAQYHFTDALQPPDTLGPAAKQAWVKDRQDAFDLMNKTQGGIQFDQWQTHLAALTDQRAYQLASGDFAGAYNTGIQIAHEAVGILGINDPAAPGNSNPGLTDTQVQQIHDSLTTIAPFDPVSNPHGDVLQGLVASGETTVQWDPANPGIATSITPDPNHWIKVQDKGVVKIVTDRTDPQLFQTTNKQQGTDPNAPLVAVPGYVDSMVHVTVDGKDFWAPRTTQAVTVYYPSGNYLDPTVSPVAQFYGRGGPAPRQAPDTLQLRPGTKIDVPAVMYTGSDGQNHWAISIDGGGTWADYVNDPIHAPNGPAIILNSDGQAHIGIDPNEKDKDGNATYGKLVIGSGTNAQVYPSNPADIAKLAPQLGSVGHWAGTGQYDHNYGVPTGSQGSVGGFLPIHTGAPDFGGSQGFDATTSAGDQFLRGGMSVADYQAAAAAQFTRDHPGFNVHAIPGSTTPVPLPGVPVGTNPADLFHDSLIGLHVAQSNTPSGIPNNVFGLFNLGQPTNLPTAIQANAFAGIARNEAQIRQASIVATATQAIATAQKAAAAAAQRAAEQRAIARQSQIAQVGAGPKVDINVTATNPVGPGPGPQPHPTTPPIHEIQPTRKVTGGRIES